MAIVSDPKNDGEAKNARNRELVQEICSREFSGAPREIREIGGQGLINNVFRVVLSDETVIIVRFIESADTYSNYDKEIWCLRLLRDCKSFRVPLPLGRGRLNNFEYMIEEYIEGEPGNLVVGDELRVWRRLGACAAEFNRLPVSGCGSRLDTSSGGTFTDSWPRYMEDNIQYIFRDDYWIQSGACSTKKFGELQDVLNRLKELRSPTGLIHIDLAPKNCIVEPSGGLALLDWEMAEGGPVPFCQLAAVAGWWGISSDIYRNFCQGYEEGGGVVTGSEKIVTLLSLMNSLHSVRWAQDNYPSRTEEYTRSAARMIADLSGQGPPYQE